MRLGRCLIAVALVCLAGSPAFAVGTLYELQETGPKDLRINIVILAEGYTAAQEATFVTNAGDLLTALLATTPWNQYSSYVNGYAIFVASNQSGSDHPSDAEMPYVDTYFNSTFESYDIDRLLTIPPNDFDPVFSHGDGKVYSLLATHLPAYDVVLLLVNDPVYGGSGGNFAISSMHPAAPEIVIHEIGHSHAVLGDEYDDPYPGFPDIEEPNTTQETVREQIKWNTWIHPATPIPTPETSPYSSVVGLFEGAHYHATDWYRPQLTCKMRSLGVSFCAVCLEAHVVSNYNIVSPIDSLTPAPGPLTMTTAEAETLRVITKTPTVVPLSIRWFDNGSPTDAVSGEGVVTGLDLGPGTHSLKCVVTDTTPLVRMDPAGLLKDSAAWTVTVASVCACDCYGDPGGDCDGVHTVLDVVQVVNVAFRSAAPIMDPNANCPYQTTDVNCSGSTEIIDVVKVVNATFRNADPATEFCNPCP